MAEKMKERGEKAEVDALIKKLGDPSASARRDAIDTLGRSKDPRAMNALVNALQSDPRDILAMAGYAMVKKMNLRDDQKRGVIDKMVAGTPTNEDLKATKKFAIAFEDPGIAEYAKRKIAEAKENMKGGEGGICTSLNTSFYSYKR
jgi:HEAT repeat protein